MILKNVLAKGQIVIPKTIRDLLGINIGDQMLIDIEDGKIIITKKENVIDIFNEISNKTKKKISMKDIKKELNNRYLED
jgi:AbrB family looped-hinge helix DNA binding protein